MICIYFESRDFVFYMMNITGLSESFEPRSPNELLGISRATVSSKVFDRFGRCELRAGIRSRALERLGVGWVGGRQHHRDGAARAHAPALAPRPARARPAARPRPAPRAPPPAALRYHIASDACATHATCMTMLRFRTKIRPRLFIS